MILLDVLPITPEERIERINRIKPVVVDKRGLVAVAHLHRRIGVGRLRVSGSLVSQAQTGSVNLTIGTVPIVRL